MEIGRESYLPTMGVLALRRSYLLKICKLARLHFDKAQVRALRILRVHRDFRIYPDFYSEDYNDLKDTLKNMSAD